MAGEQGSPNLAFDAPMAGEGMVESAMDVAESAPAGESEAASVRTDFPESWIWLDTYTGYYRPQSCLCLVVRCAHLTDHGEGRLANALLLLWVLVPQYFTGDISINTFPWILKQKWSSLQFQTNSGALKILYKGILLSSFFTYTFGYFKALPKTFSKPVNTRNQKISSTIRPHQIN